MEEIIRFVSVQTLATVAMTMVGLVFAVPVLWQGFSRRGKGVVYERNFVRQRLPQLVSLANVGIIVLAFLALNKVLAPEVTPMLTMAAFVPATVMDVVSWVGVAVLLSGFLFMIGGWYSLGECFSTDAELLDGQTVRRTGMLKYVMHPAYSGIIQSLLGAGIASGCLLSVLVTLLVVAPLWLARARYEEVLLLDTFGEDYRAYAEELRWRRLVPRFIPIGI